MSTKREFSDLHIIPLEDLEKQLKTNINTGLSTADALEKLKTNGKNVLTPPKKTPEWIKFMKTMFTGFAALLWIAGILCFIAYIVESSENPDDVSPDNLYIGCALVVVVAISGIFTYMQERQSGKIMESFSKMVPPLANVLRDGKVTAMEACDIVLGDVVEIRGGDKVPADLRIFESNALKVDNSSLTGESVAVSLKPNLSDKNRMESRNVAFFSTNVMEGSGRGIVIETGDNTGIGSIARMVSGLGQRKTPISRELDSFIKTITSIAVILGVVFFIVAVCLGTELIKAVIFLIGIIVANVPEGLLVTVTVTLTLTAKRMATKNCLVKNLEAVETLGSTSVICTDKTGTLTQNKMTVAHFWISNKTIALDTGENSYGTNFNKQTDGWAELSRIACLCSAAEFLESDQENPLLQKMKGDASEQGILRCYESIMSNSSAVREANPKVVEIPFNSSNKYQVSVHDVDRSGKYLLVMKGAPEIIFKKCKTILINGQDLKIDEKISNDFQKAYMDLGEQGERVLGFCDLTLNPQEFPSGFEFDVEDEPNFPLSDLRFVGLMSMIDPPKSSVPDAVAKCRSAGIKVIMVTGDHPITAAAIARQVGIISEESTNLIYTDKTDPKDVVEKNVAAVVPGGVLLDMEESILLSLIEHHWEIVFARTSPEQKLRIVTAFQTTGAIVAVTGDGVNDSPALKKGDIGVAMGISGSEVSKEAADMILLDDNFATIVTGVEEGRLIFDNLKKSIVYTLTSNIPEILPFLCWVIFSIPLPLSTVCILLIDLGTDMFPAISLAYEKAESDIMRRKPRNANTDRLVNGRLIFLAYGIIGFIQAAAGLFIYFVVMAEHGWLPSRLLYIRAEWDNPDINGLTDSFGQEWSYGQRKVLESTSQTAFFLAIVQVQWTDLIISKTRKVSILTQKMNNWILNSSIVFETVLAIILIYTPVVPQFVGLYPLNPTWWIPALPFSLLILIIDETRRYILRSPPSPLQRFITKETYY